ncbi:IMCE [Symbiodinium natans]|uniref:IMCE protein n=1 Tax=Symbiodinium natans TaxID=878477 RepID=A0A812GKI6_9DINO|nr:IMCE [Symbiodinium natans]
MPKLIAAASESAFFEETCALPTAAAGWRSTGPRRSGDFLTSFKDSKDTPDWFKDPDKFSPWTWRKQHNYFLDRGAKFMMVYKTPTIVSTDLFDLEKYGCFQVRGFQGGEGLGYFAKAAASAVGMKQEHLKKWWIHPRIEFSSPVSRIGVRLQDMTTGELRWDAIYDLGKAAWKRQQPGEKASCSKDGWHLCEDEEPVGGEHPFFLPDWCPGPNDGMSHKYLLTVSNLSSRDSPEQPLVGEMLFTQYGINQLDNTYAFEMHAPLNAKDQARFNEIQGSRKKDAISRITGRTGMPEGMAMDLARGKVPKKLDTLKKAKNFKPPKDASAAGFAKSKMGNSSYGKMLDNKDFAKTLA